MKVIARLVLFAIGTLLLSHYLPEAYHLLVASKRARAPIIFYSCVRQEFLFYRYNEHGMAMVDERGTNYERADFEQLLPLDNYLQLLRDDRLPGEIAGVPLTPEKIRRERINLRVRPETMDTPMVPLYPLLEAENGRVKLEMPDDFMRIHHQVEFVLAASNAVDVAKSAKFTHAVVAAGFAFPPKLIAANATTLKPYDEGYFLVDQAGATYQLRMVRGEPDLKKISEVVPAAAKAQWESLNPKYIQVQELETHEIRCFLVGGDNRPYLVVGNDYRLIPLPVEDYEPSRDNLTIRGDLLNRLITMAREDSLQAVALNRDYTVVRRHHETLPALKDTTAGQLRPVIFPFITNFEADSTNYYGLFFEWGKPLALVVNGVLLLLSLAWLAFRKQLVLRRIPDLAAVAVGGIFGVLLLLLLPRPEK